MLHMYTFETIQITYIFIYKKNINETILYYKNPELRKILLNNIYKAAS